ncbi:MAG: hypothetical protein P9M11_10715 [Candidatus Tenebribacter burtonii]|jgi:hypothetical protein|nr:hypothetical protein [Candidatus Tenebribacter burtonii]
MRKKILLILVILILILLALSYYQKSKATDGEGIKITYKDQETFLTYSKINSSEKVSFTTGRGDKLNGFDLANILKSLNIPTDIKTEYILHSKDGGRLNLIKEENERIYLVFQHDARGQFVRLVIPSDEFSQRWIKYLETIEIK